MIIKTEYVKYFITQKEKKQIYMPDFIIISIDKFEIAKSGFSEFENYGVYADNNNTHFYRDRQKEIVKFYSKLDIINDDVFIWILKNYDSITFEKLIYWIIKLKLNKK